MRDRADMYVSFPDVTMREDISANDWQYPPGNVSIRKKMGGHPPLNFRLRAADG
jgi:hypothetical protein